MCHLLLHSLISGITHSISSKSLVGPPDGGTPVSVGYDVNSAAVATWALDGSYDVGNGITATFGTNFDSDLYVGGTYDLGGGASLLVSYATDANGSQDDEIGANGYQAGTTVEVSFAF